MHDLGFGGGGGVTVEVHAKVKTTRQSKNIIGSHKEEYNFITLNGQAHTQHKYFIIVS